MTLRFRKKRRGGIKMFDLSRWPSIRGIALSGDLQSDATCFLVSNGKRETAAHCMAVGNTSGEIAARFGLDISVATTAAWLHDISNVLQPSDMLDYALDRGWAIDGDIPSSCISACRRYWRRSSLASRTALFYRLSSAALRYIDFVLENDRFLCPHPWLVEAKSWLEQGG